MEITAWGYAGAYVEGVRDVRGDELWTKEMFRGYGLRDLRAWVSHGPGWPTGVNLRFGGNQKTGCVLPLNARRLRVSPYSPGLRSLTHPVRLPLYSAGLWSSVTRVTAMV